MTLPAQEFAAGARSTPSANTLYRALRANPTAKGLEDPFTAHVFTCALTIGLVEAQERGEGLATALGLDRSALASLSATWVPDAPRYFSLDAEPQTVARDEEEDQLFSLLNGARSDSSIESLWLTSIVTRRAMEPRHLWQDLGLFERNELKRLMTERFSALAAANVHNMKWKKFFYRQLCASEGFSLCAAPTCRECGDFANCFGDEDGVSLLARIARG
jgi:nitrogen fixation protein NifQ